MMSAQPTFSPEVLRLLAESAEWRLLGLLFEYPSAEWRAQVTALLPDLRDASLRALAEAALDATSEGLHFALFGPAGTVPVREVTYQGGVQSGYLMAELSAYYDAFGYVTNTTEAADHLAVQLGFLAYLKMKQALALASDDPEHAAVTAAAAASFLEQHIAVLAEPVAGKLEAFAPDYLIEAGALILHHAGPSPRSSFPLGSPLEEEDDSGEIGCGPAQPGGDLIPFQP
ncbi:MAG: molecular chaperone TorD family protein [Acidobacteria bacterium]|nr:molecular chaperone TorD family protein [Acidobacteriota bacterium]